MRLLPLLLLVGCLFSSGQSAPDPAAPVAHLVGCWRSVGPEGDRFSVAYAAPQAGLVLGTTRHLRPDGSVSDEQERFDVGADGRLGVVSRVDGVERDRFVFEPARSAANNAVFTRVGDGWPAWLGYTRDGDTLRLELGGDGRKMTMELGAVPCG